MASHGRDDRHRQLVRWLEGRHLVEPPAATLRKALALGSQLPARRPAAGAWLWRLVFDSAQAPLPAGVRASAVADRRMLFRLEPEDGPADRGCDLDLLARPAASGRLSLLGQLLPPVSGAVVRVFAGRRSWTAEVSDAGDFSLDGVVPGAAGLELEIESPAFGTVRIGPIDTGGSAP